MYGENTSHLETYGRLYNWYAVNDVRSLCTSGWSVPTDEEWKTMEMALGMDELAANELYFRGTDQGTQLKASPSDSPSWDGSNSSGFAGVPGGWRSSTDGTFSQGGSRGHWWSSSPYEDFAWNRFLDSGNERVYREYSGRNPGFSIRCIKDTE